MPCHVRQLPVSGVVPITSELKNLFGYSIYIAIRHIIIRRYMYFLFILSRAHCLLIIFALEAAKMISAPELSITCCEPLHPQHSSTTRRHNPHNRQIGHISWEDSLMDGLPVTMQFHHHVFRFSSYSRHRNSSQRIWYPPCCWRSANHSCWHEPLSSWTSNNWQRIDAIHVGHDVECCTTRNPAQDEGHWSFMGNRIMSL